MKLPPEQEAIRVKCFHPSGTFVEFPKEGIETSIPQRFETTAERFPDRLAIKSKNYELTYSQLNEAANRVAHAILAMRGEKSEAVALMFEQGAAAFVGVLAVVKAGKFYVPLDPSAPPSRRTAILNHSTANLIVTNTANLAPAELTAADGCKIINVDDLGNNFAQNPKLPISADTFAYLVYTSGSTGDPKGIIQTHRHALYHVHEYVNPFRICPDDRASLVFPWFSSGAIHLIHSILLCGAALFPCDVRAYGLNHLVRLLVDEKITIYHSTATTLRQALSMIDSGKKLPNLRLVRFGGDAVSAADIEFYKNNFSNDCLLLNSFATSESGVISRYFFDKDTAVVNNHVPAGYPAYAKQILILDDDGKALGSDQIGEIAVKSRYLSAGYWQQPTLTTTKFIADPNNPNERIYLTGDLGRLAPDGCLYHLGRKDFQVKVRGYRVDTTEVEATLLQHDQIKEVVVIGRNDQFGHSQLVAYFVPADGEHPNTTVLRQFLNKNLPDYMIPSHYISLQSFPLTPNGKVHRRLLPDPGRARPELATPLVAPSNEVERGLAQIWGDVLSLDTVGTSDNFFDLGGDSLSASRIVSAVIKHFQLEIPLQSLFNSPTITDMAAVITAQQGKALDTQGLATVLDELESLSDEDAKQLLGYQHPDISKA